MLKPYIADTTAVGTSFLEFFLPADNSQSRIGKRNGSSACTIICLVTAHRVINGELRLPASMNCREVFAQCMMKGNAIYDEWGEQGLLSIDRALQVASEIPISLGREIFLSGERGWKDALEELSKL